MDDEQLHPDLEQARYGKARGEVDRFLGFWLHLIVGAKQHTSPRAVAKTVDRFLTGREVARAYEGAGAAAVEAQLADAARLYFVTCIDDDQYSSGILRMGHLKPAQVRAKMARDVARVVGLLIGSRAREGRAAPLPRLFVDGYLAALAPEGVPELRAAVEEHADAAELIATLLED